MGGWQSDVSESNVSTGNAKQRERERERQQLIYNFESLFLVFILFNGLVICLC